MEAVAGRRGSEVRSDCFVKVTITGSAGLAIAVSSKVDYLFGKQIVSQVESIGRRFSVENVHIELEDFGALPFVIESRVETALKRAGLGLSCPSGEANYSSAKLGSAYDRRRRSRLYLPGNEPKFMLNAALHGADGLILDLEDSVALAEKDAARILVRNALGTLDFRDCERMVRINQGRLGDEDLEAIIPMAPDAILLPKTESAEQVKYVAESIRAIQAKVGMSRPVWLIPIIESALGAVNAYTIAKADKTVVSLAIGLEDYTADLGVERTLEGRESLYLRGAVVNAAKASGIQPLDTVFSDVSDLEGLRISTLESKSLGFEGRGCIHPRQIGVIHKAFEPTEAELTKAKRIVAAFQDAESKGLGVVSLGSKMIDPPVVKRALKIVGEAKSK